MNVPPELRCLAHGAGLAADPGPTVEESARLVCAKGCRRPGRAAASRASSPPSRTRRASASSGRRTRARSSTPPPARASAATAWPAAWAGWRGSRAGACWRWAAARGGSRRCCSTPGRGSWPCDLSRAVEANHANFRGRAAYFVCQADLMRPARRPPARSTWWSRWGSCSIRRGPRPPSASSRPRCVPAACSSWTTTRARPGRGWAWRVAAALSPRALLRHVMLALPPRGRSPRPPAVTRSLLPVHRSCGAGGRWSTACAGPSGASRRWSTITTGCPSCRRISSRSGPRWTPTTP